MAMNDTLNLRQLLTPANLRPLAAPILIIIILSMMVLPLPVFLLDVFFTFNIAVSVMVMLFAAEPLAKFINDNPTVVMLALAFLIMIGMTLIAEGFGAHVPKGYVYAAMAFSATVETLNIVARQIRERRQAALIK